MLNDKDLIESLGGAAKVAELLGYDKQGGVQRVHNWMARGIPPRVKLEFPKIFLNQQSEDGDMISPLKQVRLKREQTLQFVADAVGIDTGNLSRIERGLQVPTKDLTEKLAKFFDNEVTETQIIYPERFTTEPNVAASQ